MVVEHMTNVCGSLEGWSGVCSCGWTSVALDYRRNARARVATHHRDVAAGRLWYIVTGTTHSVPFMTKQAAYRSLGVTSGSRIGHGAYEVGSLDTYAVVTTNPDSYLEAARVVAERNEAAAKRAAATGGGRDTEAVPTR